MTEQDPEKSHIGITKQYWDAKTDAPTTYGVGMAYLTLGHLLGREVTNHIQPSEVFHNMYLVNVGDSTTTRKSTSQTMGLEPIPATRLTDNDVASPERLVEIMSKKNEIIQPMGEFSKLLKGIKNGNYQATFAEVYNDLHSCAKFSRSLKSRNGSETQFTVEKPFLSIVSSCTFEVLQETLTREMTYGGLLPRWIINYGEAKRRPRGRLTAEAFELQARLTENFALLDKIDKKGAYFELSDAALAYYNQIENEVYENPLFANVKAFGGRYLNYLIAFADINLISEALGEFSKLSTLRKTSIRKLVQLVQLVELVENIEGTNAHNPSNPTNSTNRLTQLPDPNRIIVQKRHVQRAWAFLKPCLVSASELATYVDMDKPLTRVREYLKTHAINGQKVYHSDLMRMANVNAREAEQSIQSLKLREEIEQGSEAFTAKNNRQITKRFYLWVPLEAEESIEGTSHPSLQYSEPHQRRANIPNLMPTEGVIE